MRAIALLSLVSLPLSAAAEPAPSPEEILAAHVDVLETQGKDPLAFVRQRLDEVDLILFDDAWHPVVEPFDFYQALLRDPASRERLDFVFVEAFAVNHQPTLDRFFAAPQENVHLLAPMLQDDLSGHGWALATYVDLLRTVYRVNAELPAGQRLRVVAVNDPVYWSALETPEDLAIFRQSLVGNDYGMYRKILASMEDFESGKKGIFLTNTRHAYKGIRGANGRLFWNCGTFFAQWHPGRTSSIRFHHLMLTIRKEVDPGDQATSTAGLERYDYRFERVAGGLWDEAFAVHGNRPVAFDLDGTPFGALPYAGNHMHQAAPGQTLLDANDSILFLEPVEQLHNSAEVDFIYTPTFKHELARRYGILYTPQQLQAAMKRAEVDSVEALIELRTRAEPQALIPQTQELPAAKAWRE